MEQKQVKWADKDVFIHYVSNQGEYALAGFTSEKTKLFKVPVEELDEEGKKLCAYLLVKVEKRLL